MQCHNVTNFKGDHSSSPYDSCECVYQSRSSGSVGVEYHFLALLVQLCNSSDIGHSQFCHFR